MKRPNKGSSIRNYIINGIEEGLFKVGDHLPTEQEICEMFNVSRMTANRAICQLAEDGYIFSKRGQGIIVNGVPLPKTLSTLTSFTEDMKQLGFDPITKLLSFSNSRKRYFDARVAMKLPTNALIYRIERLRLDGIHPVALDVTYLNGSIIKNVDPNYLEGSLYDYIENQLGIKISHMEYTLTAVTARKALSTLLNLRTTSPVLKHTHVTFTRSNLPLEYCETFYKSDRYRFTDIAYRYIPEKENN